MHSFLKETVTAILLWEARMVLRKYRPKIIAVTGNVGKTTTKDAIFATLNGSVFVRKSDKSFNSEIGVPLTVLGCTSAWSSPIGWAMNILRGLRLILIRERYPAWLVLEVGADKPGDISRLARMLSPEIAVITSIPDVPVHVEFFTSPDMLAKEKRELAVHMRSTGTLIVNGDETRTLAVGHEFGGRSRTYGFEGHNDFRASKDAYAFTDGALSRIEFRFMRGDEMRLVSVPGTLGKPRVYAALAALAVAETVGVSRDAAIAGLASWSATPGRMHLIAGLKGSIIIDDTYNSSPHASRAALETLIDIPKAKRRIAVLGDMLELGKFSVEAHKEIGKKAAECCDMLITVGFRARGIAEAAIDAGLSEKKVRQYEHGEALRAGKELESDLGPGVVVLVKGSQSMRMERTVKEIMAEPERAPELLVRQEEEWLER